MGIARTQMPEWPCGGHQETVPTLWHGRRHGDCGLFFEVKVNNIGLCVDGGEPGKTSQTF